MAAGNDNPAGYYVGRPVMNYDEEQKAPVPPAKEAVFAPVNAPIPNLPGYYAGRVTRLKPAASDQSSANATQHNGEPGFLSKCFACFSSGGSGR